MVITKLINPEYLGEKMSTAKHCLQRLKSHTVSRKVKLQVIFSSRRQFIKLSVRSTHTVNLQVRAAPQHQGCLPSLEADSMLCCLRGTR